MFYLFNNTKIELNIYEFDKEGFYSLNNSNIKLCWVQHLVSSGSGNKKRLSRKTRQPLLSETKKLFNESLQIFLCLFLN